VKPCAVSFQATSPAAETLGIWRTGMGNFKLSLDKAWKPYLDGQGTLDEALTAVVKAIP
jgi:hypothetical protein